MTTKELIRAEIERLKKHYLDCKEYDCGWNNALEAIHTFLDNIEEPVSEDLEEAAEEYAYTNWEDNDYHEGASEGLPFDAIGHTEKCFKAGAEWQKEQMMKEGCLWT